MYNSLRTNLPRQVMSFDDFSFDSNPDQSKSFGGDPRQFPGHLEVQCYLKAFAESKSLVDAIQFRTLVTSVEKTEDGSWLVETKTDKESNS
jgi:cation diffusion facilitator CzcD-associated flavoprotein CzcO